MFKLKLRKIKGNEWKVYDGLTTELKRGHVLRLKGGGVYAVFEVYNSNGRSIVHMNEVLKRDHNTSIKALITGDEYRVIGQQ